MALYFIDFTNGNDANDGLGIGSGNAWKTLGKATTTVTAADIVRVRGGMSETLAADVTFTNDGTVNSPILIQGIYTAAGSDDWGDGNTTRPVLDFNSGNFSLALNSDNYWQLKGFDVKDSHDTTAGVLVINCIGIIIEDFRIYDNGVNTADAGIKFDVSEAQLIDSVLDNNFGFNIYNDNSFVVIIGCTINGDGDAAIGISTQSARYGLYNDGGVARIKNTVFGTDTNGDHSFADIRMNNSIVWMRNCDPGSASQVEWAVDKGEIYSEDDGQVLGAFKAHFPHGTIETDTGETPPSGAGVSMRGDENSLTGAEQPLYIAGDWLDGGTVKLDGTSQTTTVKIKCLDADWTDGGGTGGRPDNTELFMELDYNDGASSWATAISTEACVDDTYTSFTVTVTANAVSNAYWKVKLLIYDTTGGGAPVFVDPVAVIS